MTLVCSLVIDVLVRTEANDVPHGWFPFSVHTFVWCSPDTQAEANLSLAQRHYRSRVEELRELIMEEESKFKLEYISLQLYLGLIRKSAAGSYSEKLKTSEQEYGIPGFSHD